MFKKDAKMNILIYVLLLLMAGLYQLSSYVIQRLESCQGEIMQEAHSPDLKWTMLVFMRNCGLVGNGFEVHGTLLRYKEPVKLEEKVGNMFIFATTKDEIPSTSLKNCVKVKWEKSANLSVTYREKMRVYRQMSSLEGIKISYKGEKL